MKQFYEQSVSNYCLGNMEEPIRTHLQLIATYNADDIRDMTILRTGPICTLKTLAQYIQEDDIQPTKTITVDGQTVQVKPVRCPAYQLTKPLPNKQNWLKVPIVQSPSLDAAMTLAIKTIIFEYQYFKIIRLDDHINDILESIEHLNLGYDEHHVAETLISRLNPMALDYSQIQMAQLLFDRPQVIRFYEQHNLKNKCYSHYDNPLFSEILSFYYLRKMELLGNVIQAIQNRKPLKSRFKDAALKNLIKNMNIFLRFIDIRLENIYQDLSNDPMRADPEKLSCLIEGIKNFLTSSLFVAPCLNRHFNSPSLLNIQAFQDTLNKCLSINALLAPLQKHGIRL